MRFLFQKKRYLEHAYAKANAIRWQPYTWRLSNNLASRAPMEHAYEVSTKQNARLGGLGWVLSFIPGTEPFKARVAFGRAISDYEREAREDILSLVNGDKTRPLSSSAAYVRSVYPSKLKIGLTVIAILIFATALTFGLAGLAAAGVFGAGLVGLGIQLAVIKLPVLAYLITASLGGYGLLLSLKELVLDSISINIIAALVRTKYNCRENLNRLLNRYAPFIAEFVDAEKTSDKVKSIFNTLLNPVMLGLAILAFVRQVLLRLCEVGCKSSHSSIPRIILKGLINLPFLIVIAPLEIISKVADIPYLVLKHVFYEIPVMIKNSVSATVKERRVAAFQSAQRSIEDGKPEHASTSTLLGDGAGTEEHQDSEDSESSSYEGPTSMLAGGTWHVGSTWGYDDDTETSSDEDADEQRYPR